MQDKIKEIKVKKKKIQQNIDTTDKVLLVEDEINYDLTDFDSGKIVEALLEESKIKKDIAVGISKRVEEKIINSGLKTLSTGLIRELVNNELLDMGLVKQLGQQDSYLISKHAIEGLMFNKSNENSNLVSNNPEAVNMSVAETILKQYALNNVFSKEIKEAHLTGRIHLHDLSTPHKNYCGAHSIEYIKKYGLDLHNISTKSAPAKHAHTLTGHINTFLASMQSYYAGALGLSYVNISYAPYLVGMTYEEILKEAQYLVFSLAQCSFSRGGQVLFTDFNIHTGIPETLSCVEAIGPGGEYTGKTYFEYEKEAQMFAKAIMEVIMNGDMNGRLFEFPKCLDKETFMVCEVDNEIIQTDIQGIYDFFKQGKDVYLPHPELKKTKVTGAEYAGSENGIEIILNNNISIKSKKDHKYYIMNNNVLEIKEAQHISLNDKLVFVSPSQIFETKNLAINKFNCIEILKNSMDTRYIYIEDSVGNKTFIDNIDEKDINNNFQSYKIKNNKSNNKNLFQKTEIVIDHDFMMLLGLFIGDGCYLTNGIRICAPQKKETYNILLGIFEKLDIHYKYYKDSTEFHIHSSVLKKIFQKILKGYKNHASQKDIPEFVYSQSKQNIESFIRGLYLADGTVKNTYISYSTSSVKLANSLKFLLHTLEIYPTIYDHKVKNYTNTYYDIATIGYNNNMKIKEILKGTRFDSHILKESNRDCWYTQENNKHIPLKIKEIKEVNVDSYAIEVADDHTFITGDGILTKNCDLHITKNSFERESEKELLDFACHVASKNGSIYFIFDRDAITLSACCRLKTTLDVNNKQDMLMISHPEHMRYCGFQNVTINLAQAAYRAGKGNNEEAIKDILVSMDIAMNAHIQKRKFIQKMFDTKGSPMYNIGQPACDGFPYIDLSTVSYIFGVIGLNECVQYLTGKELHESDDSFKLGIKVITNMFLKTKHFTEKFGFKCVIEESPAESASRRFAKIDLKQYPESKNYIKGDIENDTYYYTNSIHFNASIDMPIIDRISKQSKFHSLIAAGAIIHAFIGEANPSKESIYNLIEKTWNNTGAAQITISPEFSVCNSCGAMGRGLKNVCEKCGSGNVDGVQEYL